MADERASIFGDEEPDLSSFKPKPPVATPAAKPEKIREVSEAANFRSREPRAAAPAKKPAARTPRQYRTGRNIQLNIKVRAAAADAFYALADQQEWVLGETFERAVDALKRELAAEEKARHA